MVRDTSALTLAEIQAMEQRLLVWLLSLLANQLDSFRDTSISQKLFTEDINSYPSIFLPVADDFAVFKPVL